MRMRTWLSTLCLVLPAALGCNVADRSTERPATEGAVESALPGDRDDRPLVLVGQLRSVDPDKRTLMVVSGDELYEFSYSNTTLVVGGTANVQGLTGETGNQITVYYQEHPVTSTKDAVRIELP